jgi:hypothetical protein
VCLADIGELFDLPMDGAAMMCKKAYDSGEWGPSVLLLDCSQCRFDLEQIFDEIETGKYSYSEFTRMGSSFLGAHPHLIRELDANWNVFDRYDEHTKMLHYTNLTSQPWKHSGHRYGWIWFQYFREAVENGDITDDDIYRATWRGYARLDVRKASRSAGKAKKGAYWLRSLPRKWLKSA